MMIFRDQGSDKARDTIINYKRVKTNWSQAKFPPTPMEYLEIIKWMNSRTLSE